MGLRNVQLTASTPGPRTITFTSADGGTIANSPWTVTASAIGYTIGGALIGAVGVPSANISIAPASATTDSVSFTSSVAGDTFNVASPLTFTNSGVAQNVQLTASTPGPRTITFTSSDGGTIATSPFTFTSLSPATGYSLGGSISGTVGAPSAPITLAPNGFVISDTISYTSSSAAGVFNPPSPQVITNSGTPLTITYAGPAIEFDTLTFQSASLPITGSTLVFEVQGASTMISFDSYVTSLPSGNASSAVVTPLVWNGTSYAAVPASNYSLGTVYENTIYEPGAYSCRVTLNSSIIPPLTVPRIAWNVAGVLVVDPKPMPCSAVVEAGYTDHQAIGLILDVCIGLISGFPNGPVQIRDANNTTNRITAGVDGNGNILSVTVNPPTL